MTKNKLNNFDVATLNYFITRAFLTGYLFNSLLNLIKQDSWIIPIFGILIGIIFSILIIYIFNYETDLNFSQKIFKLFNKNIAFLLIVIFCFFCFFMCVLTYLNLNNFIHGQFLSKTPTLAIAIVCITSIFYILTKGLNVIAKTGNILFYIAMILFFISFIGLLPFIELENLKPFFNNKSTNYLESLNYFYSFNIVPMLFLTILPKNKINNHKLKKTLILSFILSAFTMFIVMFSTLASFGYELTSLYKYPEFHVLKNISLMGLEARIESILIIQCIFDFFMFVVITIYFIANSIKSVTKLKNINTLYFTLCLILVIITNYFSKYNVFLDDFALKYVKMPITIFSIIFVLIICIKIKFNKKKKTN